MISVDITTEQRGVGLDWKRLTTRMAICAMVWIGLTGWDPRSWLVGGPLVVGVAVLSLRLSRPRRATGPRWSVLPGFLVYFVHQSLRGGWDVAWRVLHPSLPIAPQMTRFRTGLAEGPARWVFLNLVSLLPGTLSAGVEGDCVVVHALDGRQAVESELRELEDWVARWWPNQGEAAQ